MILLEYEPPAIRELARLKMAALNLLTNFEGGASTKVLRELAEAFQSDFKYFQRFLPKGVNTNLLDRHLKFLV